MQYVLICWLLAAAAMGRVPEPPSRSRLLHKLANSEEMLQYMLRDPGTNVNEIGGDLDKTTPELIRENGYPAEEHDVTTKDGYILTLHRIPHGADGPGTGPRPVVHLQHGLLSSSSDWIMQPPAKALGYMLADQGYDVWLGNARGNTYSRQHVNMTSDDPAFWKFTWDQMGQYDAPAMIDYILNTTSQQQLYWVGHSMGSTMFWVMMHDHPEYNAKVRLMHALGPVARVDHMSSVIRLIAPLANDIEPLLDWLGKGEFLPANSRWMHIVEKYFCDQNEVEEYICSNVLFALAGYDAAQFNLAVAELIGANEFLPSEEYMTILSELVCEPYELTQFICDDILFLLCGFDSKQLNKTALPVIVAHTPAGASTRTVVHYAQEINEKKFVHFDWGRKENMIRYGQEKPPEYSLDQVTCPVVLCWSDNDILADPTDVTWLAEQLPNMVEKYRVPLSAFNHLDYLWAIDADTLVYNHVIENLKKY